MSGFDGITFDDALAIGKDLLASIFQPSDVKEGETGVASCLSALVDWIDTAVKGKGADAIPVTDDGPVRLDRPSMTVAAMVDQAVSELTLASVDAGSYKIIGSTVGTQAMIHPSHLDVAEQWRLLAAMCADRGMP